MAAAGKVGGVGGRVSETGHHDPVTDRETRNPKKENGQGSLLTADPGMQAKARQR
jgi:hypothetical protein